MKTFKELNPKHLKDNTFSLIDDEWMLVSAGDSAKYNTMTASWGGLGILWFKNVSFVFVRPTRYTYELMNSNDYYTLSFFDEEYRDALTYCGKHSGRDVNKAEKSGLTPVFDKNSVYFSQAKMVMVCKKLYYQDIDPSKFLDGAIADAYPMKDYHRMYVGEITDLLVK